MSPLGLKAWAVGVLALLVLAVGATWKVQDWRYGKQLAVQDGLHQADLAEIDRATATQVQKEQDKRHALEQKLATSEQTHHQALTNEEKKQARLRDRLATADLRLSVLIDEDPASCNGMPATPGAVGVVHGARRAQLDPAHAQRIIAITDTGDRGLIALTACQAYVREVNQR
ncbi:Putative phage lysis protein [Pseudomonas brassicacearum subsp. brassicacearum NFM421]|uniref:Putative phage lysis protein n=1 Tax=Pseudomonas brassicacearum (strain NFM421) TaxID=994484 RepID=F2KJD4_PSEBN|nr:lysis system i-spanin subunit Rz [Pseudomonas brassicacearum]AEA70160.1 Putative phage lysis protein [Pseudomonas brassicacearum subsp. brassicacearum NFM421]